MLALARKVNESIMLGNDIEITLLQGLGQFGEDDLVVLVLATIPQDVKKTSVNLKAPLIINAGTRKGVQLVAENQDYEIKHFIVGQEV